MVLTIDLRIDTYVQFLKDFVTISKSPIVINANLCWKKGTIFVHQALKIILKNFNNLLLL